MKLILITGGCGFVGSNLLEHLSSRAPELRFRIIDNESLGKHEYISDFDVEFIHGDLRDSTVLDQAAKGVDAVVHLAADTRVMDSIDDPAFNFSNNVVGTFNLITSMKKHGVTRLVNASTGGAILGEATPPVHEQMVANPLSPYGASKLAAEGYLSAFAGSYGFFASSLRFSNVYGPRSFHKGSVVAHFFKQILASKPLVVYGDGSQTRDYIFTEDICEGIYKALTSGKTGVFQLGTGIPTTINQLIDLMREVVGDSFRFEVQYKQFRPGEIKHTWCDISKAKRELGFEPKTDLIKGLEATWQWFLERI